MQSKQDYCFKLKVLLPPLVASQLYVSSTKYVCLFGFFFKVGLKSRITINVNFFQYILRYSEFGST